jgi:hypothetical protein
MMRESQRLRETRRALDGMRDDVAAGDPELFDQPETDEQIENVAAHEGPVFMERALAAVAAAAKVNQTLTATDARYRCPDCDCLDARAWGQVMRTAARRGWIRSTGTYRPGPRSRHGAPLLQWRSLIYSPDWEADEFVLPRST